MDYIGEKCSACGREFTEEDDIVVCPECGSPHHRECYNAAGKCANEDYHAAGSKWKRAVPEKLAFRICPVCRFPNTADSENCQRCGSSLINNNNEQTQDPQEDRAYGGFAFDDEFSSSRPYLGFDPNEDMGGATIKEVTQFVHSNTLYYLPIFKHMKDFGTKMSFNLTCLVFPSLYFANRKMWGWAVFAVVLSILMSLPMAIIYIGTMPEIPDTMMNMIDSNKQLLESLNTVCGAVDWIIKLIFCLFGNRMYFNFVINSVKKLKARGTVQQEMLAQTGGVKPVNMLFIVLIKFGIAMVSVIMLYMLLSMTAAVQDFGSVSLALF